MSSNKVFCEKCRRDVEYVVTPVAMIGKIKGKEYHYAGSEARCVECGALVYVPELNDSNLRSLYDVFRQENGIVPLDTIRAIPEKYDIGKRPLSLLLGWGEHTFSRYVDGDMPTRQYSDILSRIYNEPRFYSELLEANKANLPSPLTYEKSRHAVDALLSSDAPRKSKIKTVVQYLLYRCEDITPLSLQKALYYIQGFFHAFYAKFIFAEDCQAWVHGPVYRDIYFQYRDYHFDPIERPAAFDSEIFSASEKAIYDSVVSNICCYSGKVLERFTHNEAPWLITRGDLPLSEPSDRVIEKAIIGEYFDEVKAKYNMVSPSDIAAYAQEMFRTNFSGSLN